MEALHRFAVHTRTVVCSLPLAGYLSPVGGEDARKSLFLCQCAEKEIQTGGET